jgi:hypothetical protein
VDANKRRGSDRRRPLEPATTQWRSWGGRAGRG